MELKERESVGAESHQAISAKEPAPEPIPMLPNEEQVSLTTLLPRVRQFADKKARLATITCLDVGGGFELIYHFDQNLELSHLRLPVGEDEEVPSISGVYLAAFLVENEIKELFGVKITGLAVDYGGRLLLSADGPQTPMRKDSQATGSAKP